MRETFATSYELAFGPFRLDVAARQLRRDGVVLDLRRQAFHALEILVRNRGRYVKYEQMIREAWGGLVVSQHTVDVTVREIREVLMECGTWVRLSWNRGYWLEVPESEQRIRTGWHFANRYTFEGLEKALECFKGAVANDSADFRAFEGLSSVYLMLGSLNLRPSHDMYRKFAAAHKRAVVLGGYTAELRADRGHALHVLKQSFAEAEAELVVAIRQEPKAAAGHGYLALLYATSGRLDRALDALDHAYAANALWPLLPVVETLVRIVSREFEPAVRCAMNAVDLHPDLPIVRFMCAQALENTGQLDQALAQYRRSRIITPSLDSRA